MINVQYEVRNLREIEEYFARMPEEMFDDAKRLFQVYTLKAYNIVQRNVTWRLQRRSGNLARSIQTSVTGTSLRTLEAGIHSRAAVGSAEVIYAPIHEYGGTIEARNKYVRIPGGPYLNIPTDANRTAAGVQRMSARDVFFRGGYMVRTRTGTWGVFLAGQMMFFLTNQRIHIPPRLGMRTAVDRQIDPLLRDLADMIGEE